MIAHALICKYRDNTSTKSRTFAVKYYFENATALTSYRGHYYYMPVIKKEDLLIPMMRKDAKKGDNVDRL